MMYGRNVPAITAATGKVVQLAAADEQIDRLQRLDVPVARRERRNLENAGLRVRVHFTTWSLPLMMVASSSGFSVMP